MAKKGNGNSVVNLGAGAIDFAKKLIGARIGGALTGTISGVAAGSRAASGLKKGVLGKKGK